MKRMKDAVSHPRRRNFLAAAGLAGAAGFGGMAGGAAAPARGEPEPWDEVPFYGPHQAGITTPMQQSLYFASFDLTAASRTTLIEMLRGWTVAAARLTAGQPLGQDESPQDPPRDSGEAAGLGPRRLTLTFGFGPEMFSLQGQDRYGIAPLRPAALADLPRFPGDQFVAGRSGGAVCIQACADDPQVAFHAVRQLARISYGAARLRWVQTGFSTAGKTPGTPRNLLGFKDGTMNPTGASVGPAVWAGAEGPPWMRGGSYMVARRIRIALEHWDRMSVGFQERTIGRRKQSGAPLTGKAEFDPPDFAAADADGNTVIPENAHMRLAAPASNDGATLLRRSYSYDDGASFTAERWPPWRQAIEYDAGLFFQCFQKDPRSAFIPVFDRLARFDALNQFTTHVGGAIFACPPGVAREGGYVGQTLFEA